MFFSLRSEIIVSIEERRRWERDFCFFERDILDIKKNKIALGKSFIIINK